MWELLEFLRPRTGGLGWKAWSGKKKSPMDSGRTCCLRNRVGTANLCACIDEKRTIDEFRVRYDIRKFRPIFDEHVTPGSHRLYLYLPEVRNRKELQVLLWAGPPKRCKDDVCVIFIPSDLDHTQQIMAFLLRPLLRFYCTSQTHHPLSRFPSSIFPRRKG